MIQLALRFELKKIICNPLFFLFLSLSLWVTWSTWDNHEASQLDYIRFSRDYYQNLNSDLQSISEQKNDDLYLVIRGAMSDITLIDSLMSEKKWDEIPFYKKRLYKDLATLKVRFPDKLSRLSREEVVAEQKWIDWLYERGLPDTPRGRGWSFGKQLEGLISTYFSFGSLFVAGLFFYLYQMEERRSGYQKWKVTRLASSFDIEMGRLLAKGLALLILLGFQFFFLCYLESQTEPLRWNSLELPVEFSSRGVLLPLWFYLSEAMVCLILLLILYQQFLLILDVLLSQQWLYAIAGLILLFAGSYLSVQGKFRTLVSFPELFRSGELTSFLGHLFGLGFGLLVLQFVTYGQLSRPSYASLGEPSEELITPRLGSLGSLVHLISLRRRDWQIMTTVLILFSVLFFFFTGIMKATYLKEEKERIQLEGDFYRSLDPAKIPNYLEGFSDEEINRLKRNTLEQKRTGLAMVEAYHHYPTNLPQAYLNILAYEEKRLKESFAHFEEGSIAGEETIDNLERLSLRNQLSQVYWRHLSEAGVPATSRGSAYIVDELEESFVLSSRTMQEELEGAVAWFQSTDRSGIGGLRTLVDTPLIWILIAIALWFGLDGKAREVEQGTWRLYQTQALNHRRLLLIKWGYGLGQSLVCFIGVLFLIFSLHGLWSGFGYLEDGIILFGSTSGEDLFSRSSGQVIWFSFLSNSIYLSYFFLACLLLLALLVSLGHFLQLLFSRKLVAYLILIGGLALVLYQIDGSLEGLRIFSKIYQLVESF